MNKFTRDLNETRRLLRDKGHNFIQDLTGAHGLVGVKANIFTRDFTAVRRLLRRKGTVLLGIPPPCVDRLDSS